jgi:hypothetical protein
LVDELPEESFDAAAELLRHAQDPVVATLYAAPEDDEPLTPEEENAAAESWAAHRRGESVSLEDFAAESESER